LNTSCSSVRSVVRFVDTSQRGDRVPSGLRREELVFGARLDEQRAARDERTDIGVVEQLEHAGGALAAASAMVAVPVRTPTGSVKTDVSVRGD